MHKIFLGLVLFGSVGASAAEVWFGCRSIDGNSRAGGQDAISVRSRWAAHPVICTCDGNTGAVRLDDGISNDHIGIPRDVDPSTK